MIFNDNGFKALTNFAIGPVFNGTARLSKKLLLLYSLMVLTPFAKGSASQFEGFREPIKSEEVSTQ